MSGEDSRMSLEDSPMSGEDSRMALEDIPMSGVDSRSRMMSFRRLRCKVVEDCVLMKSYHQLRTRKRQYSNWDPLHYITDW